MRMSRKALLVSMICMVGCMLLLACGKKEDDTGKLQESPKVQEQEGDLNKTEEQKSVNEDKPDKERMKKGEVPKLLRHRGYAYELNKNDQTAISHRYSFLTLDEKYSVSHRELADGLKKAKEEIETEEKEKRDKEKESLKENELYSFEENWYTYMRRNDGMILSFVTEYVAVGGFDGEYYTEYKAHNYFNDSGKEIKFGDVVTDEDAFFDILAGKFKDYYDYAKKNIYYIDADINEEQIKEDIKNYMNTGDCAWTIDPQGISFFLNSYTGLPSAVSETVLFSEDKDGTIFCSDLQDIVTDEWIMQIPEHVDSYCDIDDNGKSESVRAFSTEEMQEDEGSEQYYISGLHIGSEGNSKSFLTRMTGGTDFYDVFLIHKDHRTCLLEGHYEYDTAFINTYTIDDKSVEEADAIRARFETTEEDYDPETENYDPCYIPTDMSKIRVLAEEDNEARDTTSDILSVGADGKMKLKYGEYEHVSLGVNETGDKTNDRSVQEQEPFFGLWVGAFKDREDAEALVNKLRDNGLEAYYVYSLEWENLSKEPYYCVTIGKSGSESEAQAYIADAGKEGYKDAYVKYSGERLSHRIDYYVFSEDVIDISPDEVILNNVQINEMSGGETGEATLIVDKNTVFDKACDMRYFGNYRQGDSVLDWFNYNKKLMDTDIDKYIEKGPALKGVFEVSITGNHIDSFHGCYWWD